MTARELLAALRAQDVTLWAEADKLRYRAPSGTLTAELREALSAHKPELLRLLAGEESEADAPLSIGQQALYFLHAMTPSGSAYHLSLALRLRGGLSVPALGQALAALSLRHPVLRARITTAAGRPRFCFDGPPLSAPLVTVDGEPGPAAEARLRARIEAEADRPFDLAGGERPRAALYRLPEPAPDAAPEHVLHLCLHHLLADGWSLQVILRELSELYAAARSGTPAALPPIASTHHDFAAWQAQLDHGEAGAAARAFWQAEVAGVPPLDLITDRPRPPVRSERGERHEFALPAEETRPLRELGQRLGATLSCVLLAAWQALLSRLSGQADFAVGMPYHARTEARFTGLCCYAVNTLPLRAPLADDPPFSVLVGRLSARIAQALAHGAYPLPRIVENARAGGAEDLGRTPLFQSVFAFENLPGAELVRMGMGASTGGDVALGELRLAAFPHRFGAGQYDLDWIATLAGDELAGHLSYSTDLFEPETVARFAGHLRRLLADAAAAPERRVSELALHTPAELDALLERCAPAPLPPPAIPCFHLALAQQAARTPDAPAVVYEGRALTYAELDAQSSQLAWRLQALGAQPGRLVAILLPRSVEQIVAVFGVLKAGAAYLPLDPQAPAARVRFILTDAAAIAVVTTRAQEAVTGPLPAPCVLLDEEAAALAALPGSPPQSPVGRADLAYVIYTSGSTGQPRGVRVHHGAVMNFWRALELERYACVPQRPRRVSLNFALSFDGSMPHLCLLLTGSCLYITPLELRYDPALVLDFLVRAQIEVFDCTPTQATALVQAGLLTAPGLQLRGLLCAGEAIPAELWQVLRAAPGLEVWNGYGPTECTVVVTLSRLRAGPVWPPVLGRPLANMRGYVLDAARRPVPYGVRGELYVAGDGVALGYLNRPDETARRFLPVPESLRDHEPDGGRVYRTGDVCYLRPDGLLVYVGREDEQVKLRGYRIELGEIDAALRQHAAVRAAAVVLDRTHGSGDRLVAYVVPAEGVGPDEAADLPAALARHLRALLPAYMVPAAFVSLPALPLTVSGKLDRRRLPAPTPAAQPQDGSRTPPRTATEQALAALYAEVLHLPEVGADDSFFQLGGHSLLAGQLTARLEARLHVRLPVRALFESPTVVALAARIDRERSAPAPAAPPGPTVPPDPRTRAPSAAQQAMWQREQQASVGGQFNIPLALRIGGALDVPALVAALTALVDRHEALRTSFVQDGPVLRLRVAPPGTLPLPPAPLATTNLRDLPPPERLPAALAAARAESARSVDPGTAPLLRARLYRLDDADHVLLLLLHHIVADGASGWIALRDLSALYESARTGRPAALPSLTEPVPETPPPAPEALAEGLAFFAARVGTLPALSLPLDHPRPAQRRMRGALVHLTLPPGLLSPLAALARQADATPFLVWLAAWTAVLAHASGQPLLPTSLATLGRRLAAQQEAMGFFTSTLLLRADLRGDPSFQTLVTRLRDELVQTLAHDAVPFRTVVSHLPQPAALLQTALSYQRAEPPALPGHTLTLLPVHTGTCRRELALYVSDFGDHADAAIEYDTELFDETTVARLGARLAALLTRAAAAPELPLSALDPQSPEPGAGP